MHSVRLNMQFLSCFANETGPQQRNPRRRPKASLLRHDVLLCLLPARRRSVTKSYTPYPWNLWVPAPGGKISTREHQTWWEDTRFPQSNRLSEARSTEIGIHNARRQHQPAAPASTKRGGRQSTMTGLRAKAGTAAVH